MQPGGSVMAFDRGCIPDLIVSAIDENELIRCRIHRL